jgi:hypothetical protein
LPEELEVLAAPEGPWRCPRCSREFENPNQLGFHLNRFVDTPKMSACEAAFKAQEAQSRATPKRVEQ